MVRYVIPVDKRKHGCVEKCTPAGGVWGVRAVFIIRDGVGVKYFSSADERDNVMNRQADGASVGLAPAVYDICEVYVISPHGFIDLWYGYQTEIAAVCEYTAAANCPIDYDLTEESEEYHNLITSLEEEYGSQATADLHTANIGRLDDGCLVCIDWGWD